ncbi:MAG: ABC transporter ATP-binding protein [Oscillospiraceae bacterium]
MGGHMGGGMPGEKAKDFKGTLKKLLKYLGNYKIAILFVMIFAICSAVFSILGPKVLGSVTTELFNGIMGKLAGTSEGVDFGVISGIILWLIVIYLASMLFALAQGFIMTRVSNQITYRLRGDIDEKIHKLPFSYYDKVSNGDVLSRLTNDVDSINQGLNQSLTQIITSVTTVIGVLIMMLTISWQMTLIAVISLPVSMLAVMTIGKKSQKYFIGQQEYLGSVNGIVEENFSCHTVVKAFNGEDKATQEFSEDNNKLYNSAWKANFLSGLMMPIMNFIGNIGYVVVCVVGGYFAVVGSITVGNIQAFIQYMRNFTQPITQLSQISNVIQQTMAAAERVFGFLNEEEDQADVENALTVCTPSETPTTNRVQVSGNVSFENVSFGYVPGTTIINNFNARVNPGQKIAIVGPTGAGKTTMVKLLMRFYDVNSGKICLDGHDLRSFNREDMRTAFGMVLQETWLFNGTIADNIRYGKLDSSLDDVKKAAKIAQADHFIRTLPGGYDMILIEEASNVSQGQKQLLTIARAVLADPKILILDEATSSVDTRTEGLIQKAMDNLMSGRTSFVIAHRLSTIRDADLILVMNNGDIVEQGTHTELLTKNGFYANLYNSQFAIAI